MIHAPEMPISYQRLSQELWRATLDLVNNISEVES